MGQGTGERYSIGGCGSSTLEDDRHREEAAYVRTSHEPGLGPFLCIQQSYFGHQVGVCDGRESAISKPTHFRINHEVEAHFVWVTWSKA